MYRQTRRSDWQRCQHRLDTMQQCQYFPPAAGAGPSFANRLRRSGMCRPVRVMLQNSEASSRSRTYLKNAESGLKHLIGRRRTRRHGPDYPDNFLGMIHLASAIIPLRHFLRYVLASGTNDLSGNAKASGANDGPRPRSDNFRRRTSCSPSLVCFSHFESAQITP